MKRIVHCLDCTQMFSEDNVKDDVCPYCGSRNIGIQHLKSCGKVKWVPWKIYEDDRGTYH